MLEICYDAGKGDLINKTSAFIIVMLGPTMYHCFTVDRNREKERILFKGLQKIRTQKGMLRLEWWAREGMEIPEKVTEFNPSSLDTKEEEMSGKRDPRKMYTSAVVQDVQRVYVKNLSGVKAKFMTTVCCHGRPIQMETLIAKDDCLIVDQGEHFISLDNRRLDEREETK